MSDYISVISGREPVLILTTHRINYPDLIEYIYWCCICNAESHIKVIKTLEDIIKLVSILTSSGYAYRITDTSYP